MPLASIPANIQDQIIPGARAAGAAFLPKPLTEQALADVLTGAQARSKAAPP